MQEFYAAMINADSTEGRGPMMNHGTFTSVEPAFSLVVGQGVMGVGDGNIDVIRVFDTIDEMKQFQLTRKGRFGTSDTIYDGRNKKWTPGYAVKDPKAADPDYQRLIERRRQAADLAAEVEELERKFK